VSWPSASLVGSSAPWSSIVTLSRVVARSYRLAVSILC
jgi:hypothetical protein